MRISGIKSAQREPLQKGRVIRLSNSESYQIVELLSDQGGFSLTYLAKRTGRQHANSPLVVIKELFPAQHSKRVDGTIICPNESLWASLVSGLNHEVALAQRSGQVFRPDDPEFFQSVDHLSAAGSFTDEYNNYYVVYSTYKGTPLRKLIDSGWRTPADRGKMRNAQLPLILSVLTDLAAKLHVLHEKGIYHLDLSPDNVFLGTSNSGQSILPFLLDFGSALDITEDHNEHLYTINPHWSAPELFPLAEYGPKCGYSVSVATDTYSLCAILFFALTGGYTDESFDNDDWDLLLLDLYPSPLYGDFAEQLIRFFSKGLSPWPDRRFVSADRLYEDLKSLEVNLLRHKGLLAQVGKEDRIALSMMYADPPHNYYCAEDTTRLLFWGAGPAADSILKCSFHSQQMSGKNLNITVVDENADLYREQLLAFCPDLPRFSNLGDSPEEIYGTFTFDSTSHTAEAIAAQYPDDKYVVISLGSASENKAAADALWEQYRTMGKEPSVIYYVCDAISRDSALHLDALEESPVRHCFAGSDPVADLELEQQAFAVHLSYCGIDQSETERFLSEMASFANGSGYNQLSSAAAAIHTSAKLASLNLSQNISPEAWDSALKNADLCTKLLILEHQRWNAFMLTQGFAAPKSPEDILVYAFKNGSRKFHSEDLRIHPCLLPSSRPITANLFDPSLDPRTLDPLDTVSLCLHELADRIRQKQKPIADLYLSIIVMQTESHPACERIRHWLEILYAGQNQDLDFAFFKEAFRQADTPCDTALEGLHQSTRAAIEYVSFKDYKAFDLDIIRVVRNLL
jgi:serine/threonine protein kinase